MIEFLRLFGAFLGVGFALLGLCFPVVIFFIFFDRIVCFFAVLRYKKLYPDIVNCKCFCLTCKYLPECAFSLRDEVGNEFKKNFTDFPKK